MIVPAEAGSMLVRFDDLDLLSDSEAQIYRKGTGKLLHSTRWSKPDVSNPVRDQTRRVKSPGTPHDIAMKKLMKFVVGTEDLGWILKPNQRWDGFNKTFEFVISGRSDWIMQNAQRLEEAWLVLLYILKGRW